jgi:hypothetical protein
MKHPPHSNQSYVFFSLFIAFFSFTRKKESISGQNLIDNLLNFGLIKKSFTKKKNLIQLAD